MKYAQNEVAHQPIFVSPTKSYKNSQMYAIETSIVYNLILSNSVVVASFLITWFYINDGGI